MRIVNQPGDAVLCLDGKVKVNRKVVGVWWKDSFPDIGRSYYFFSLAEGKKAIVSEYYCHVFRAAIPAHLEENGIRPIMSQDAASSRKPVGPVDTYEQERKERKSRGARYGYVTRRILAKEPLTGKTLELALEVVAQAEGDKFHNSIAKKLQAGQPLDDYERHIMVDVYLLHSRLGGGDATDQKKHRG